MKLCKRVKPWILNTLFSFLAPRIRFLKAIENKKAEHTKGFSFGRSAIISCKFVTFRPFFLKGLTLSEKQLFVGYYAKEYSLIFRLSRLLMVPISICYMRGCANSNVMVFLWYRTEQTFFVYFAALFLL